MRQCKYCKALFKNPSTLWNHEDERQHHWRCESCNHIFSSRSGCYYHCERSGHRVYRKERKDTKRSRIASHRTQPLGTPTDAREGGNTKQLTCVRTSATHQKTHPRALRQDSTPVVTNDTWTEDRVKKSLCTRIATPAKKRKGFHKYDKEK